MCQVCWRLCEGCKVRESRMVCKLCELRELCETLPLPVLRDIAHFVGLLRTSEWGNAGDNKGLGWMLGWMLVHENVLKVTPVDLFLLSEWSGHTCNEGITTFSRHCVQIVKLHRSRKDPAKFATFATVLTKDMRRDQEGLYDMGGEIKLKVCDDDDETPPYTYTVTLKERHHQKDIRTDTTFALCGRNPRVLSPPEPLFPSDPRVLKLVFLPTESIDAPRNRGDKSYTVVRPRPQSVYTRPVHSSWVAFDLKPLPM
jgi:hypothetical protein